MPSSNESAGRSLKILLHRDFPYQLTPAEHAGVQAIFPEARIVAAGGSKSTDRPDLTDVEVLVTDQQLPPDLSSCPRLRWIQLVSAGANQIVGHPVARTDILVTTASGLHGVPIAQFVTGALLMLVHNLGQMGAIQSTRRWPDDRWALRGAILRGQTVGVLGYGSIGRECARQLAAVGMRIVAIDPAGKRDDGYNYWPGTGDPDGDLPERWCSPAEVRTLLPLCDVLVIAAPLTPQTEGMIGAAELALAKKGSRIIIISRGGIVDERALADALRSGHIAGAVVDCFTTEPPAPDHFFYDTPNLIMTPHVAGAYEGFWPAFISLFTENLRRFKADLPLLNQANKRLGY